MDIKTLPSYENEARGYIGWGPHEDYMISKDPNYSARIFGAWRDYEKHCPPHLVADFYFSQRRDGKRCEACEGTGHNPETLRLQKDFYDFERTGRQWRDDITQDEVEALVRKGRLSEFTDKRYMFDEMAGCWKCVHPGTNEWTPMEGEPIFPKAEDVNRKERQNAHHDASNAWTLLEVRAKRLGVWGGCGQCEGGWIRLSDDYISLNLWAFAPEDGSSRGVEIKKIEESEIADIKKTLSFHWEALKSDFEELAEGHLPINGPWAEHPVAKKRTGWAAPLSYKSWKAFYAAFEEADDDLNVVGSVCFERGKLYFWMMFPRKGCGTIVTIESVEPEDMEEVQAYAKQQLEKHRGHFAWAIEENAEIGA